MNNKALFDGIEVNVDPHFEHLLLSERVRVYITKCTEPVSNIIYIGVNSILEGQMLQLWLGENGGIVYERDRIPLAPRYITRFPLVQKIRDLSPSFIWEVVRQLDS